MNAKQYLNQVKRLDALVNSKIEQLKDLHDMATKITTEISGDRVQTSLKGDKIGGIVTNMIALEDEINATIDKLVDVKRDVMQKIDQMQDRDFMLLLSLRYLNFKTWERIAVDMNFTFQWVHVLHKKALEEFEHLIVIDT